MAVTATCPNGHVLRVKDEFAGKSGLCPKCHARVFVPMPVHSGGKARISDDEILGLLGTPSKREPSPPPPPPDPTDLHDAPPRQEPVESGISLRGSSVLRRVKICPKCAHMASPAFTHCPRCGTPLPDVPAQKSN